VPYTFFSSIISTTWGTAFSAGVRQCTALDPLMALFGPLVDLFGPLRVLLDPLVVQGPKR
jgi:hypothetical protein